MKKVLALIGTLLIAAMAFAGCGSEQAAKTDSKALKVGKKYTITATYADVTVKQTVKVKK